jgi:zinc transporter 9
MFWVGILLIISAGSFLYVATLHILPEVLYDKDTNGSGGEAHGHHHHHNSKEKVIRREDKHYSKGVELLAIIVGLIAPLGLTFL